MPPGDQQERAMLVSMSAAVNKIHVDLGGMKATLDNFEANFENFVSDVKTRLTALEKNQEGKELERRFREEMATAMARIRDLELSNSGLKGSASGVMSFLAIMIAIVGMILNLSRTL
jgi:hypothetical protein